MRYIGWDIGKKWHDAWVGTWAPLVMSLIRITCWVSLPQAASAWEIEDARRVAQEYAEELKEHRGGPADPLVDDPSDPLRKMWDFRLDSRVGVATYREKESDIESEYVTLYPELSCAITAHTAQELELTAHAAVGQSLTETEDWDLNGVHVQTNDLDFFQVDAGGAGWQAPRVRPGRGAAVHPFCGVRVPVRQV